MDTAFPTLTTFPSREHAGAGEAMSIDAYDDNGTALRGQLFLVRDPIRRDSYIRAEVLHRPANGSPAPRP